MRTNLCRTLIGFALLASLVAAPAPAGTAIAVKTTDGIALVTVPAPPDHHWPRISSVFAPHAEALALAPDGRTAVAYLPTGEYLGVPRDGVTWRFEADRPSATGWVPGQAGRLLNLSRDRPLLVDPALGVVVTAPQPAERFDLIGCASSDDDGPSWCLGGSGDLFLVSRDGEIILAPRLGGSAIELGMGSNLVLATDDQIAVFDVAANRAVAHVSDIDVQGLSSDPQSGLLLVQVGGSTLELRDLASLALLSPLALVHSRITQAELLHGGGGIVAIVDDELVLLDLHGEIVRHLGLQAEAMVVGPWQEPLDIAAIDAASQGSVNDVNSKLDDRLDAAVSSRATQASVDQANAKLDATVSSRATQASVDQANARLDATVSSRASQGSVDIANAKLDATVSSRASQASVDAMAASVGDANARLDATISSRATQASVDQANARLDATVSSRATQASVDAMAASVGEANARLDATISSRATQASVDQANARLDATVSSRATQASVDAMAASVGEANARLDATISSRASQVSLDRANGQLDASVSSRASQLSVDGVATDVDGVASGVDGVASQVDAVGTDVDTVATDVAGMHRLVDVAASSRASQSSVDGVASRVTRIDGLMDASVTSRATQDSVDALADDLAAAADDAAEARAGLLDAIAASSRRGIENALIAGVVEPMFLIPGGADADPALDGATCPGLAPAGHAAVHADGLFESVRCVTRRAIDAMTAIGEDTRSAQRAFADGEAERRRPVPAYRAAVGDYARALGSLSRGR